ncbi:hypothetical protein AAIB41_13105 [Brucella sp. BE17]|uniref:hypothetical protein n=1 Tax=Brucella sp. BE17 TaxID=3142977 RepID=UPI0031BB96A2
MSDTRNNLQRFDLCLSLSEMAINSQLAEAWRVWAKTRSRERHVIVRHDETGSDIKLTARLDVPSLSLIASPHDSGKVLVSLPIKNGEAIIVATGEKTDLGSCSLSFLSTLERKPVSLKEISRLDPDIGEDVGETVHNNPQKDSTERHFAIQALYLNLIVSEHDFSDFRLLDALGRTFDSPHLDRIREVLLNALRGLGSGQLLMGTIVYPKENTKRATTLAPLDFRHNIRTNDIDHRGSSIDYFGVFEGSCEGRSIENEYQASATWLDIEKITGNGVTAGIMAIKGRQFSKLIAQKIAYVLGVQAPVADGDGWLILSRSDNEVKRDGNIFQYDLKRLSNQQTLIRIFPVPTKNMLELSIHVAVAEQIWLTSKIASNFEGKWSKTAAAYLQIIMEDTFGVDEPSIKLRLSQRKPDFSISPLAYDEIEHSWTRDVDRKIGSATGGSVEESCERAVENNIQWITQALQTAFTGFSVSLDNFDFVPPGEQDFIFTTPRFSPELDLLFDVNFKSPVIRGQN